MRISPISIPMAKTKRRPRDDNINSRPYENQSFDFSNRTHERRFIRVVRRKFNAAEANLSPVQLQLLASSCIRTRATTTDVTWDAKPKSCSKLAPQGLMISSLHANPRICSRDDFLLMSSQNPQTLSRCNCSGFLCAGQARVRAWATMTLDTTRCRI